eukprot:11162748-Lingulodinium_polyedra.AAC.1
MGEFFERSRQGGGRGMAESRASTRTPPHPRDGAGAAMQDEPDSNHGAQIQIWRERWRRSA